MRPTLYESTKSFSKTLLLLRPQASDALTSDALVSRLAQNDGVGQNDGK